MRNNNRNQDRPNILWLVNEENSQNTLGSYGDLAYVENEGTS